VSPSDPLTLTLTVWKVIGYASYHDQQQTMSVCACQTHNSFQLLFLSTIGGILGDGRNQKGVLVESLHWWEVPNLSQHAGAEPILMQFIANSLSSALIVVHVTTRHFWCAKHTWEQYQVQV